MDNCKEVKSLRWLANQFPLINQPKDDADRFSNCIHLYCSAAADALTALTEENAKLRAELERMKAIMRDNGIIVIPPRYPGGKSEWNIWRGPQKEK